MAAGGWRCGREKWVLRLGRSRCEAFPVGACLIAIFLSSGPGAWWAGVGGFLGQEGVDILAFAVAFVAAVVAVDAGWGGNRWPDTLVVKG